MSQSNSMTAIGTDIGKAALALVWSCSPRARAVRRRLREIASSATSAQALGAVWSAERLKQPAGRPIAA